MSAPILVGIDFSIYGHHAFETAIDLAKAHGTSLVLVHAVTGERYKPVLLGRQGVEVVEAEHSLQARDELLELTTAWAEHARERGLEVTTVADEGDPAPLILRAAKEHGARMIVVGTHGRTGLDHLLMGSVAESVVKKADRPVVVVPAP